MEIEKDVSGAIAHEQSNTAVGAVVTGFVAGVACVLGVLKVLGKN